MWASVIELAHNDDILKLLSLFWFANAGLTLMSYSTLALITCLSLGVLTLILAAVNWRRLRRQDDPDPEPWLGPAGRKARKLFLSALTADQLHSWNHYGVFVILGSDGRRYTIANGYAYNVTTREGKFCAYPDSVPDYDRFLAQKLLIETDAPLFREIANFASRSEYA